MARWERAILEPGWIGRFNRMHQPPISISSEERHSAEVIPCGDRPLYIAIEDGVEYVFWSKDRIGFVR